MRCFIHLTRAEDDDEDVKCGFNSFQDVVYVNSVEWIKCRNIIDLFRYNHEEKLWHSII